TDARPPVPLLVTIIVQRPLVGPAVVSGPGRVAALEKKITRTIVTYYEDHVTLNPVFFGSQFAEVNTADPVAGNSHFDCRLPLALPQSPIAFRRVWLDGSVKWSKLTQLPGTRTAIASQTI